MGAYISGQASLAVVLKEGKYYALHLEHADDPIECADWSIPHLFADCSDVEVIRNTSESSVRQHLELMWTKDRAVHLFLILLDKDEDRENRALAAECLEGLFSDINVETHVGYCLYSAVLPGQADASWPLKYAETMSYTGLARFIRQLVADQLEIRKRCEAWESLPLDLFDSTTHNDYFITRLRKVGAIYCFVTGKERGNLALLNLMLNPRIRGLKNSRTILQQWAAPFRERVTDSTFNRRENAIEERQDEVNERSKRGGRRVSGNEALKNVQLQKDSIKELLNRGERALAWRYARELVQSQREKSEPKHIAMSLCDLAQHAKSLGDIDLQLNFSKWASKEMPTDPWPYAQVGDAYRSFSDYQKALEAFQQCGALGDELFALCGRAEVLKDTGAFDESIAVYNECIKRAPDSSVPVNGRASVYAARGDFNSALALYKDAAKQFADDPVSLCARAQVLRDMGRLTDALSEIEEAINRIGFDSAALCTKAGIQSDLSHFGEAVDLYNQVIAQEPMNLYALNGLAYTYREMGEYDKAMSLSEEITRSFKMDASGYSGKADVLRRQGNLGDALRAYEAARRKFPRSSVISNGFACVLTALGRFREALSCLPDNLPATFSEWVAYHIRGMIALKERNFDAAIGIFRHGLANNPWGLEKAYYRTALSVALIRRRELTEAVDLLSTSVTPALQPVVRIIQMHAFAEMANRREAFRCYYELRNVAEGHLIDVRDRLHDRYLVGDFTPNYLVDEEIFTKECNAILLAA